MRILIADDSLFTRRLLEETLRGWSFDVVPASDGTEAMKILSEPNAPSIAILDWMMPGFTGPELCRLIRQKAIEPYTYIILLTSRTEKDDVVAGMDSGADDYLTKPFDRHELKVRLRAGTRIVELQEELLSTREALREQATRDHLTQIWNRSAILETLSRELARSKRDGKPVGVVMGDIDHFKTINDTWGHGMGDKALKESARRISASLRPYDSVGRYGGEEFLIVLPGTNLPDAAWLADRVRLSIRNEAIHAEGTSIQVSCSFGCTSGTGGEISQDDLIRIADDALYAAKRGGRDRVVATKSSPDKFLVSNSLVHPVLTSARPETD
ncbi:MAG: diguanylate cyclase [Bryobacteraceae bacterium]|nr:diguanylate cyclase [Bryobacteraceae bacterium]